MNERELFAAFEGKNILVTGGTGSFGHQIVRDLLRFKPARINIYSRDEKKQYDMALAYHDVPTLKFNIGDVRSLERTREAMRGIDIAFNAAALKQVPNCEFAPFEAVETNITGANNVRRAAIEAGVKTVLSVSTDKAVKPVNVMGMTKAIQERIILDPSYTSDETRFLCVRYGNVLGSRGSVVPLFCDLISRGRPLTITNPAMTRFQLTLKEAVKLVLQATVEGTGGDLWVRKMPACNVVDLARAVALGVTGREDYPLEVVGTRPGEKVHEVLVSEEEMWRAEEREEYYRIPGWAVPEDKHGPKGTEVSEYSSDRTRQMSVAEILDMLRTDGWVKADGPGLGPKALANGKD